MLRKFIIVVGCLAVLIIAIFRHTEIEPIERIIGGDDIDISETPWQISLELQRSTKWKHCCGGSIISPKYVITAAHCTQNHNEPELRIRAGTSTPSKSGGQTVYVTTIHQNPNYNTATKDGDISILELSSPLTFNSKVGAIKLPSCNCEWTHGDSAFVSGWGRTSHGSTSLRLQGVKLHLISRESCQKSYYGKRRISANMLCAGVPGGGKDSCQGDSGGPLIINEDILAGVVSWGIDCATPEYPGVYADVVALRSFIKEITGL